VTAEDLKERISEHIATIEGGEAMTVIDRDGKPIAEITPIDTSEDIIARHDPAKRLQDFVPGIRPARLDFDAVDWLIYDREKSRY
jgi:antitoxin (DNA-binding transcriptional repressor) of toxin-antitoxin stability system